MSKKALLIVNPVARVRPPDRALREAVDWLRDDGWELAIDATKAPGHAATLAREAAAGGMRLVIVCGGDGSISEAANGLAGTDVSLGVIPAGTARVWAKEAQLPKRPLEAAQVAANGVPVRMDLGRCDGRHFFMMAGVGLDGRVTQTVSPKLKRYLGATAYGAIAVREALRYRGTPVSIRLDDETISTELLMMVVGNTRNYAGVTQLTPYAVANDGLLDVCIFSGGGAMDTFRHLHGVATGRHTGSANVIYRRAKRIELPDSVSLPTQLDGDYWTDRPKLIEIVPQALTMMLPDGANVPSLPKK